MEPIRDQTGYLTHYSEFRKSYLVHCPTCNHRTVLTNTSPGWTIIGRIACSSCGYNRVVDTDTSYRINTKEGEAIAMVVVSARAKELILTLWYSASFKGFSFWAINDEHLAFLQRFIEATHRARNLNAMSNTSIGSRLPKWMTASENRKDLLKLIDKLLQ